MINYSKLSDEALCLAEAWMTLGDDEKRATKFTIDFLFAQKIPGLAKQVANSDYKALLQAEGYFRDCSRQSR